VKLPVELGVPLIVITFEDHEAVTPVGNPVAIPIPVAPVVLRVIGVKAVFTISVVEVVLPAVLSVQVVNVTSLTYDVPAVLVA
jgi:hypothetical protein